MQNESITETLELMVGDFDEKPDRTTPALSPKLSIRRRYKSHIDVTDNLTFLNDNKLFYGPVKKTVSIMFTESTLKTALKSR